MPSKKRKLKQHSKNQDNEPPKKKPRHNSEKPNPSYPLLPNTINKTNRSNGFDDNAPKCPNPYTPPNHTITKRNPSPSVTPSPNEEEYENTPHSNNHNTNEFEKPKPKPKSQSTKRQKYNYRKSIPSMRRSEDSLMPSTPMHIRNEQIVNIPLSVYNRNTQIINAAKHGKYPKKRRTIVSKNVNTAKPTFDFSDLVRVFFDKGWLFILIGFGLGYLLCLGIISLWMEPYTSVPKQPSDTRGYTYIPSNGSCVCDIKTNTTCMECKDCMDKYWEMYALNRDCVDWEKMKQEIEGLNSDISELKQKTENGIGKECVRIENELVKCQRVCEGLEEEIVYLRSNIDCIDEIDRIGELEHELGECNVEWMSCVQLGRQRDALDKKRVEEIEKQKRKFNLCNEQLKKYKAEAKENKKK